MTQDFKGSLNLFGNLSLVVNATVNKLDVFAKSSGAVPDANNVISVLIPDGNGVVLRSRSAAYLSGTSQFILADGVNYWTKGSLDAEIKTACVYAIWDGSGIVWALAGYSGFEMVTTTTSTADEDYFLLEASSTYTRSNSHYCVCVGRIRYQYDTADNPDHTIQATVENSPRVIYNPKSDYGYTTNLAARIVSSGADIAEQAVISRVVKQTRKYSINGMIVGGCNASTQDTSFRATIKTGSGTYASAVYKRDVTLAMYLLVGNVGQPVPVDTEVYLNAGDTIHLGGSVVTAGATAVRQICGDDAQPNGTTHLTFRAVD